MASAGIHHSFVRNRRFFKEVSPAWNNPNLADITRVTKSSCILAHVRAATIGGAISRNNCHPYTWNEYAFMHNGTVNGFSGIRRALQQQLSDESFNMIQGSTDTEHLFALYVDEIKWTNDPSMAQIADALETTIQKLAQIKQDMNIDQPSSLNLLVTNGKSMVACRYATPGSPTDTLYYHSGASYSCEQGEPTMTECEHAESSVLIASEPLNKDDSWQSITERSLIMIDEQRHIESRAMG